MTTRSFPVLLLLCSLTMGTHACRSQTAPPPTQQTQHDVSSKRPTFQNLRSFSHSTSGDFLIGGTPSPNEYRLASSHNFKTVINLRGENEMDLTEHRRLAQSAGLTYVHFPVDSNEAYSKQNIEAFAKTIDEAQKRGPVILHCGSGNRVGAMLALRGHWLQNLSAADALQLGKDAGMTSLAGKISELLQQ